MELPDRISDDEGYGGGGFGGPRIGMGGPGMGGGMGRRGSGRRFPQAARPDGKILERISKATGGRLFEVSKKQPIDQIYAQIEDELRNQYSLGYTPNIRLSQNPACNQTKGPLSPDQGRILC
jgi:hypothetical protein